MLDLSAIDESVETDILILKIRGWTKAQWSDFLGLGGIPFGGDQMTTALNYATDDRYNAALLDEMPFPSMCVDPWSKKQWHCRANWHDDDAPEYAAPSRRLAVVRCWLAWRYATDERARALIDSHLTERSNAK